MARKYITISQAKNEAAQHTTAYIIENIHRCENMIFSIIMASCYGRLDGTKLKIYENTLKIYTDERDYRADGELTPSCD